MPARKKKITHGGARPGAGRKKRVGFKQGTISMPVSAWKDVKRLAAKRKARGEKNISMGSVAGELVKSAVVYFDLEPEKRAELEAFAKERGCTFDEIVSEAVAKLLDERRGR